MRALRKLHPGANSLELVDVPVPEPGPGEARIAVIAAGMCGTDLHIIDGSYQASSPVTLGHEITGIVDAVGSVEDEGWIGVRVAPEPAVGCGHCTWCRGGFPMHCRQRRSTGTHIDGGFAPFVVVPSGNLHALPEALSDYEGVLVEPLACVCNALLDPDAITPGDRVIVTGPGTIGILAAQFAMAAGARTTLVGLDRDAPRLALAATMGLDARSLDDQETSRSLAEEAAGRSINTVIECAGALAAVDWALASLRPRGRLVQLGLLPNDATVAYGGAILREITITSSYGSTPASWERAIEVLAAGQVRLEPLITSILALDDWAEGVHKSLTQDGIKVIFDPRLS